MTVLVLVGGVALGVLLAAGPVRTLFAWVQPLCTQWANVVAGTVVEATTAGVVAAGGDPGDWTRPVALVAAGFAALTPGLVLAGLWWAAGGVTAARRAVVVVAGAVSLVAFWWLPAATAAVALGTVAAAGALTWAAERLVVTVPLSILTGAVAWVVLTSDWLTRVDAVGAAVDVVGGATGWDTTVGRAIFVAGAVVAMANAVRVAFRTVTR
jgi:hypothetical protein